MSKKEDQKLPEKVEVSFAPILAELGVKEEKAIEISNLLKAIDDKSKEWDALAQVEVTNHEDVASIKLAGKNRLRIKNERLEMEKFIKAKRDAVKEKMEEFVIEDKAYLKVSQYYEKEAKEKEDILKEKEETAIRYAEEQKKILRETRQEKLKEVCDTYAIFPVETMTEEDFNSMYETYRLAKQKREEEEAERIRKEQEAEAERIRLEAELEKKKEVFALRRTEMTPYFGVDYVGKGTIDLDTSEEEYQTILSAAVVAYTAHEKALEEERKAKEIAQKEEARKKSIQQRLFGIGLAFNGSSFVYKTVSVNPEDLYKLDEKGVDAFIATTTKQIADVRAQLQKELEEQEAARQKEIAAQVEQAKKAAQAAKVEVPILSKPAGKSNKDLLSDFIESFSYSEVDATLLKDAQFAAAHKEILDKFAGFKKWGKTLIK